MKAKEFSSIKHSEPDKVDAYMKCFKHPLKNVVEALRRVILSADSEIGEEIKWNAPAYFYTGKMQPFNPKEYKRHIVVFNHFRKDLIRLVFLSGAKIGASGGLLVGDYADGRRLALFSSMDEVKAKKAALQQAVGKWLSALDRS